MSEHNEWARYCSCHKNVKFISFSLHVIVFLLYGQYIYMVQIEKQALIQILGINTNKKGGKKGWNRDVDDPYDHSCYI